MIYWHKSHDTSHGLVKAETLVSMSFEGEIYGGSSFSIWQKDISFDAGLAQGGIINLYLWEKMVFDIFFA